METLGRVEPVTGKWTPILVSFKDIVWAKVAGSRGWEDGSLTSDCPAGASGSGWRCSALSASAAPAAADVLCRCSAGAH